MKILLMTALIACNGENTTTDNITAETVDANQTTEASNTNEVTVTEASNTNEVTVPETAETKQKVDDKNKTTTAPTSGEVTVETTDQTATNEENNTTEE